MISQIVDVYHPELPNVSKEKLRALLAKSQRCDEKNVILFGFHTQFGGGKSTGFCLIYDNLDFLRKHEPRFRQVRVAHFQLFSLLTGDFWLKQKNRLDLLKKLPSQVESQGESWRTRERRSEERGRTKLPLPRRNKPIFWDLRISLAGLLFVCRPTTFLT